MAKAAGDAGGGPEGEGSSDGYSSSDDDLPPIPRFQNRKVVMYAVTDSDSEDE